MKKIIALLLVVALTAALSVSLTLAYLKDEASDVNVMTLGNVYIEQIEQEWNADKTELVEFTQGKPLYPYVGTLGWADTPATTAVDTAAYRRFTMENVVDKYVSVKNTGDSPAYVRTFFAFEMGEYENIADFKYNVIGYSYNKVDGDSFDFPDTWEWGNEFATKINGKNYMIREAVHVAPLAPDATTIPSLLQVYMNKDCGNDEAEKVDGNNNGTYDILVFSQAVQTEGFKDAETALNTAFGDPEEGYHPWIDKLPVFPEIHTVSSAEELETVLTGAGAAGAGDTMIVINNDIDLTGEDWTPIKVDGYHGADVVTINGNGHTIKGLSAPLFAGGFAGGSGIVIKNLTIADSEITSSSDQGSGAFVECADSMDIITLENCHLKNSTVNGSRTGGLIGWTAGYNKVTDGPVKLYVTVRDCSVVDCTINGSGSVGAIIGHSGGNAWTYTTVENCAIKNCKLNSTDTGDWRTGVVVGTANVGEMTISNITESGNTLTQTGKTAPAGQSNLYGRFVPGETGKLIIDGTDVVNGPVIESWDGMTVTPVEKSEDGYYHISNGAELAYINTIMTNNNVGSIDGLGIKVILDADIDLGNKSWTPIGLGKHPTIEDEDHAFEGIFDGNGHTIYNVKVDSNYESAGLFGYVKFGGTEIKNLTVVNVVVTGTSERVGAIAGLANGAKFTNCKVSNANLNVGEKVGGIVGDLCGASLTSCDISNSAISSTEHAGSLTGRTRTDGSNPSISSCKAENCTVRGADGRVGELVGTQSVAVDLSTSTATNVTVTTN